MAGRPKKEFDAQSFADLIALGCNQEEICWFFRDSSGKSANIDTLSRWCVRTYGMNFQDYRKQNGLMAMKIQLRKNQLELSKKSAAMAIWLGKQYLDQKESVEREDKEALALLDAILKERIESATKSETE